MPGRADDRTHLQSLELNPETFSPELQVKVGQIVKMPDAGDASVYIDYTGGEAGDDEALQGEDCDWAGELGEREQSKAERRRLMREALMGDKMDGGEIVQVPVTEFASGDYRLIV